MADYTLSAKVTGDSKSFQKAVSEAEKGVTNLDKKTADLGKGFTTFGSILSKIGGGISAVGDKLTSYITKPAVAATSALVGLTLVKGFGRLTGIDDARAKLLGLGHDAESITSIMESALASVKGTSYGMDEAATTAAGAVAAGVKQGQELTRYLGLTADAAAIAGVSMSEMGSILNKVQTSQRAYTMEINQLADRGLPIYQWLAAEAGTTADAVRDMASKGEISSNMFLAAIEKNIGGAAKIMGENSFTAAIDNIGASISRIGANFLDAGGQGGGFFSTLKPLLADFNNSLGVVEEKAAELGVKFGEAFQNIITKVMELKAKFDDLSPAMQNMFLKTAGIGAAVAVGIGPALKVVGSLTTAVGGLSTSFGKILPKLAELGIGFNLPTLAIAGLIALLVTAFARSEDFRNAVGSLLQSVVSLGTSLVSALMPAVTAIMDVFLQLADVFAALMAQLLPIITSFIEQFAPVLTEIAGLVAQLVAEIAPLVSVLLAELAPVVSMLMEFMSHIMSALMPTIITIVELLIATIKAMMPVIRAIVSVVSSVIQSIIAIVTPIIQFITGIMETIVAVISPIVAFVANIAKGVLGVISPVIEMVSGLISALIGTVSSVFQTIYQVISSIMSTVGNVFRSVFSSIQSAWSGLTGFVQGIFNGIASGVTAVVNQIKGIINGVIGAINGAIWVINKIPGVNIGSIPYLAHGTDNWPGGAARMNEGGRGEIVILPSGSQVIPHDVSMKYAREAGRQMPGNSGGGKGDYHEGDVYVHIEHVEMSDEYDADDFSHDIALKTQRERRALSHAPA